MCGLARWSCLSGEPHNANARIRPEGMPWATKMTCANAWQPSRAYCVNQWNCREDARAAVSKSKDQSFSDRQMRCLPRDSRRSSRTTESANRTKQRPQQNVRNDGLLWPSVLGLIKAAAVDTNELALDHQHAQATTTLMELQKDGRSAMRRVSSVRGPVGSGM